MNKQKDRPYKVLIIDDDATYVEALYRDAQAKRILLQHVSSLEQAKELDKQGVRQITAVILDVVCMQKKGQEVPNPDFLMPAIEHFGSSISGVPIVILTGEPERYKHLKEYFQAKIPVYSKGKDEAQLLTFLQEKVQKLPREVIIRKHPNVFAVIETYIGQEAEEKLVDCLLNIEKTDPPSITATLNNLRKLQELLYIGINRANKEVIPDDLINPRIENARINRHLKGNFDGHTQKPTSTEYIRHNSKEDRLMNFIYKGCSDEVHISDYDGTKYTVLSLVFAYMDLLLTLENFFERIKQS